MASKNQNFEMWANNLKTLNFTITEEDSSTTRKDLTGMTIKWALSRKLQGTPPFSTDPLVEKTSDVGAEITVTDFVNGELSVYLQPADTATLSGVFYHELEAFDGSGDGVVLATGDVTINRNVVNT